LSSIQPWHPDSVQPSGAVPSGTVIMRYFNESLLADEQYHKDFVIVSLAGVQLERRPHRTKVPLAGRVVAADER
jgi:hypothetical protein